MTFLYSMRLRRTGLVASRNCWVAHPQTSLREVRHSCKNFTMLFISEQWSVRCNCWNCDPLSQVLLVRQPFMLQWWMTTWTLLWLWWMELLNSSMSPWPPSSSKVDILHSQTQKQAQTHIAQYKFYCMRSQNWQFFSFALAHRWNILNILYTIIAPVWHHNSACLRK